MLPAAATIEVVSPANNADTSPDSCPIRCCSACKKAQDGSSTSQAWPRKAQVKVRPKPGPRTTPNGCHTGRTLVYCPLPVLIRTVRFMACTQRSCVKAPMAKTKRLMASQALQLLGRLRGRSLFIESRRCLLCISELSGTA